MLLVDKQEGVVWLQVSLLHTPAFYYWAVRVLSGCKGLLRQ